MKSVVYLARVANKESVGIINKVKNTTKAINDLGYSSRAIVFHDYWLKGSIKVAFRLLKAKEDLIILRSDHHTLLAMFLPMVLARIRGKKIVVDIPNPVYVAANEIEGTHASFLAKKMKKILLHITFPLSLLPANRILQYAPDSEWVTFGVNEKVKLVGNGVLIKSIPFRVVKPHFDQKNLNLIGAGHLAFWHGYDLLIQSINAYNIENSSKNDRVNINFWIVGDGFEKENLIKLTKELNLENQVHFLGVKEGEALAKCFEQAHVGICNLAQFRKKLFFNSELKARDYSARGIPFVLACEDFDFKDSFPFVFRTENNNTLIEMAEIIKWYAKLDYEYDNFSFIRGFAVDQLDYTAKVRKDILSVFE